MTIHPQKGINDFFSAKTLDTDFKKLAGNVRDLQLNLVSVSSNIFFITDGGHNKRECVSLVFPIFEAKREGSAFYDQLLS
jgi:hypothetical protein